MIKGIRGRLSPCSSTGGTEVVIVFHIHAVDPILKRGALVEHGQTTRNHLAMSNQVSELLHDAAGAAVGLETRRRPVSRVGRQRVSGAQTTERLSHRRHERCVFFLK